MKIVKQSFAWWCFEKRGVDPLILLNEAKKMGFMGVEFLPPVFWNDAVSIGLTILNIAGHIPLERGFNHIENHDHLISEVSKQLDLANKYNIPLLTVFTGNRDGISDEAGFANTVIGLKQVVSQAEEIGVILVLELLNSIIDHPDHQCDRTAWGAAVCEMVDSPNLKLLYDVYHMQVMEGDVVRSVQNHLNRIAHLHIAGFPGRNDIDGTQEIDFAAFIRAVVDSGYEGFVGHEFLPKREPLAALRASFQICDI